MSHGPGEILRLIKTGEATTRSELLDVTGLSRVTVTRRLELLRNAGIVREHGIGSATGGRRSVVFAFDPPVIVLAAALDVLGGEVALMNSHGVVLCRDRINVDVAQGPEVTLSNVAGGWEKLLRGCSAQHGAIVAAALSVPGPADPVAHRLYDPPTMPGWSGWPIVETIQESFSVPVFVENDADAMAFGEASAADDSSSLVMVKASDYIGAGLVIEGKIYRGTDGGAGDIGHVKVGGQALCRCGRHGCLAAEASGAAIVQRMHAAGVMLEDAAQLHDLVERGNSLATAEIRRAGELIGSVLATVVGLVNPSTIVVGGSLSSPELIAAIRSAVYAGSLPRATRNLNIMQAQLGADAALVGLTRVAVDAVYSVQAVDAALGQAD